MKLAIPLSRLLLAALAGGLLLSACGGGDDDVPETVRASADSARTHRNQTLLVDVLANDQASRGGRLSLAAISAAPAHGQAVIEAGKLRYTPASDYFGADRLSYQVRLDNGATASAELSIQVDAAIALSGTVSDGPIAQAAVVLEVGGRSYSANADEQGRYRIEAVLQQPGEMLRLQARGVGARAHVVLSSLLGEAAELVRAAGSGTSVDEQGLPAARVTHLSTAQEALVLEANQGNAPSSRAALEAALGRVDPMHSLELAAAIKLVVDGGLALPEGVPDTLALVRSAPARSGFATRHLAALSRMTAEIAGDGSLGSAHSPIPAGGSEQLLYYFVGRGAATTELYRLRYRADGSASVRLAHASGEHPGRWSIAEGELRVDLEPAVDHSVNAFRVDPATGRQVELVVTQRYHQLQIRPLAGTRLNGQAQLSLRYEVLEDGVQRNPPTRSASRFFQQRAPEALASALSMADFAPGSVWGGLGFATSSGQSLSSQDLVEFQSEGRARQRMAGLDLQWRVVDGALELQRANGERLRYLRLQDLGDGEQRWLREHLPGEGRVGPMDEALVVRQDPALALDIASLTGLWRSQINLAVLMDRFYLALHPGGGIDHVSVAAAPAPGVNPITRTPWGHWSVQEGRMWAQRTTQPNLMNLREWTPLARNGNKLMVLEWRASYSGSSVDRSQPQFRTNIYTLETEPR